MSAFIASFHGKGPWLIRATPAAATWAAEGAPGQAMKLTGSGEALQNRSSRRQVGEHRHEDAARAGLGISMSPRQRRIDHRRVMRLGLGLDEDVGARVDEEIRPDRGADRGDAGRLQVGRVQARAADHLILEIAADRAGRRQPGDIAAVSSGATA